MKFKKKTKVPSTHVCNGCGSCCRDFAFIRLSENDIKTLEAFTGLTSEEFTDNIDKAGEKRFMKFQENGDCIFLNMIDGAYSCSVYEARSVTCRGYPSTDIQIETCRVNSDRGTAFRWTHDGFQCIESPDIEIEVPSPRSVYGQCIGVRARSREDTIGILKKGLPVSSFEKLHKRMDISSQDLARFTHIALRTLQRRRQKKRFQTDESERLLRVGILFDKAIEVLGSIEAARDWMRTPKKSLADQTPLEYCATEPGAREVEDLLGRTEHGVFS